MSKKMRRPLHHDEWHDKFDRDSNWADQPPFVIMHGKHVYRKSSSRNARTWYGVAVCSTVRGAELITRLLTRHHKEAKP